eukprot:UN00961
MYLFEYLLSLSNEVIGEIQTSLNVMSYLPTLIDQYHINIRRQSNQLKQIEPERNDRDEYDADYDADYIKSAIIMDGYITLIQTKQRRKIKQRKYYELHQKCLNSGNPSLHKPITDRKEFLDFFDEITA